MCSSIYRNINSNIEFDADLTEDMLIPVELFDSAVENLLENLKEKKRLDPNLLIKISAHSNQSGIDLLVADTGQKIKSAIVKDLLKEPVKSDSGLGIGLYQVARLAQSAGYTFRLTDNDDGNVCFELSNRSRQVINLMEAGRP